MPGSDHAPQGEIETGGMPWTVTGPPAGWGKLGGNPPGYFVLLPEAQVIEPLAIQGEGKRDDERREAAAAKRSCTDLGGESACPVAADPPCQAERTAPRAELRRPEERPPLSFLQIQIGVIIAEGRQEHHNAEIVPLTCEVLYLFSQGTLPSPPTDTPDGVLHLCSFVSPISCSSIIIIMQGLCA